MSVLGVISQKGGVGKTTVALNLALAFARRGFRTVLIDVDPQGGIGLSLTGKAREGAGLAGWRAGVPLEECLITTRVEGLSLMPVGSPPWADIERWATSLSDGLELRRLASMLHGRFDLVIFDSPAGLFGPTQGVLRATSHLIVPLQAEPLALRSVPQLLEVVASAQDDGSSTQLAAVLLTMVKFRDEISASVAQEAWGLFPESLVLEAYIPRDPAFVTASAKGVPVGLLAKRPPPVASAFDRVAQELEPRIGLAEESHDDEAIPLVD